MIQVQIVTLDSSKLDTELRDVADRDRDIRIIILIIVDFRLGEISDKAPFSGALIFFATW